MRNGFLLVLSGPSGVGKGTICESLLKKFPNIKYSISATTRPKRPSECEGINYYFYSKDQFESMIKNHEFLEYATVHGNFYGTPKRFVMDGIAKGDIVILEIDVQGAMQIKQNYPDAVFVFLLPPNLQELKRRIVNRSTEDASAIDLRLQNAEMELKFIERYDYAVINDNLDKTIDKIVSIIEAERLKVDPQSFRHLEINQKGETK